MSETRMPYEAERLKGNQEERLRYVKGEAIDPWVHRTALMKCENCMWFVLKKIEIEGPASMIAGTLGRCRRHSPELGGFPAVFKSDWCGDHKLDENKI